MLMTAILLSLAIFAVIVSLVWYVVIQAVEFEESEKEEMEKRS